MLTQIKSYLGQDWESFQKVFRDNLGSENKMLNKINGYLFERTGKQLRPVLSLLAARACAGKCTQQSILCAAASEMIHTATLLHDDVADSSPVRRGSPSVMALYSAEAAVLLGDFWLSRAIRTIIDNCDRRTLKKFAGCIEDLAEGEMIQLEKAGSTDTSFDDYMTIIGDKTASLFRSAMVAGAYSVDANDEYCSAIDNYAYHLGIAFQMRDDVMDYSPSLNIGKPYGQDIKEGKKTLPLLCAMDILDEKGRERLLNLFNKKKVRKVLSMVEGCGGISAAQDVIDNQSRLACDSLAVLPYSEARDYLVSLAKKLSFRVR